ncbi:MAG TPA: Sec-independent protein translocase subunit TatA [Jatrophihabitantaceae bacterium]|nr:Sec-independent protein translocase subunit TatA [Jatrophihabitantaceae bacterium]
MWDAPWHWVVLALVVIALFGYKRMPDAARSLGRSLRIFRTEIKGMTDDDAARAAKSQPELPQAPDAPAPTVPTVPSGPSDPPADAAKPESPSS